MLIRREKRYSYFDTSIPFSGPGALASKYIGGEHRHDTAGGHAYVAIAGDCAGSNLKEIIAGHLLQKVLGSINIPTIVRCSCNDTNVDAIVI